MKSRTTTPVPATPKVVRCAIYARKSNQEGLGQEFNSLDAQRQAGENYIASMKHEGWVCLPEKYEDGGWSGGNIERPALKRLLADVEAGRIDCAVVYKVDRLSRSLIDFGKLMSLFEKHGVAFVSITQRFDTTQSMGRLTLNMLLSFAQFEREVGAERTRDKIALSRQRGRWTGGRPVLGYDIAPGSRLVVNPTEADIVRRVFTMYLDRRSLAAVVSRLNAEGITTKAWTSKQGRAMGGTPMTKGLLWTLLSNELYVGRIPHHDKSYAGIHEAIIDAETFGSAQRLLARNGRSGDNLPASGNAGALSGLVECARCKTRMTHTSTCKRSESATSDQTTRYRYYSCASRILGGAKACPNGTVPADAIETFVLEKIAPRLRTPEVVTSVLDILRGRDETLLRELPQRREAAEVGGTLKPKELADLDREIARIRVGMITREGVVDGLDHLDDLWSVMTPTQRRELLRLVVLSVRFDGHEGRIDIDFADGINNGVAISDGVASEVPA